MLKQKLQQKLLQKLSPQQIQLIKLLEVPTIELEQRIKKELEENPILEEGSADENEYENDNSADTEENDDHSENDDEFTMEDYIEDEETPAYRLTVNNYSRDEKQIEFSYHEGISLSEILTNQLGLLQIPDKKKKLAEYIIGNIDESGYLRREISSIVDDLAFTVNIKTTEKELLELLKYIQDFDPAGVGARDLQECLLIQIARKIKQRDEFKEIAEIAHKILSNYFIEFTKKHYKKIISRLNISEDTLKDVITFITKLTPRPGSSLNSGLTEGSTQHITPDFIIEVVNGMPEVTINSRNVPDLRINKTYSNILKEAGSTAKSNTQEKKDTLNFVKQKLDSAKWFIDAIKQRENTLLLTMGAIMEYQLDYFTDGDETMLKPMILKDIAEKTNLDISTISRVANSKYVQTHFGIIPLKYFFSEGMQTDAGEEVSTREIKSILQECIAKENKKRPLTDERLAKILQDKGYQIARRTVAKYREQLGIMVARLRKNL